MTHEQAVAKAEALVDLCPAPNERNCFGSDTFAYASFLEGIDDDPFYDVWIKKTGIAAIKAARAGIPFAEATVAVPTLRPAATEMLEGQEVETVELSDDGPEQPIIDLAVHRDSISDLVFRVGQYAYICGQQDKTTCPIFTTFTQK